MLPPSLLISIEPADTIATIIRRLLDQAESLERLTTRYLYRESVLRYLTGAQLEINMGNSAPTLNHQTLQYWVWDQDCSAQYVVGNTMYIVTGTPGEPLLSTLRQLVALGWRPLVISRDDRIEVTNDLLADADLLRDVSAMSLEMFIYSSIRRRSVVTPKVLENAFADLFETYNQIVRQMNAPVNLQIEVHHLPIEDRVQNLEHPQPYATA